MEGVNQTIVVDGEVFPVCFHGFHEPMEVYGADGKTVVFLPWTYRDHLNALRLSLVPVASGLELSKDKFCQHVLRRCCPTSDCATDFDGLALWWASGGEVKTVEPKADSWLDLGPVRVRLKGWSNTERMSALSQSVINDETGESFDVVGYLDLMVGASIEAMEPVMDLDELDPAATAILIEAVANLNAPENPLPDMPFAEDSEAARGHARTTLRLCAVLGWSPSKVWDTPAAEVDRLLAMIDVLEPVPVPHPMRSPGLADYPDAVVIRFEDD